MRGIKLGLFLVIMILFMPFCISMPTSYDTAQIPNNGKNVKAGVSVQIGKYSDRYRDYKVRGDLQVGYGVGRFFEGGANGGVAVGIYSHVIPELQVDIYPYIKLGIPTNPVRFSLKYSLGRGLIVVPLYGVAPFPLTYADILFGMGNPEFLTVGLRVIHGETPLMLLLSSHLFGFTLSFMYGYYKEYYRLWFNIYFGIGKTF